ncbi:MAG TPA: hypothetical protein VG474_04480 [Solirubrobacteraceae bacterium]|nr:hypothetical protein [Solirubrobacteraceae bacterium]
MVASLAALMSVYSLSLLPPRLEPRGLQIAGAFTRISLDRPRPLMSDRLATDGDYHTLRDRTVLLGTLMTSQPAMRHIARRAGIDANRIAGVTRITADVPATITEPDSEQRANDIIELARPYRLEVQPDPQTPTLLITTQAPTVAEAQRLADAAAPGLEDYRLELARRRDAVDEPALRIEQLGRARGAVLNAGAKVVIAGLTFAFVFAIALAGLALAMRLRTARSAGIGEDGADPGEPAGRGEAPADTARTRGGALRPVFDPSLAISPAMPGLPIAVGPGGAVASPGGMRVAARERAAARGEISSRAGDWPHTTRVLPWLVAIMLAVVWLVPFNVVTLSVSLPIDVTFDRLVLPVLVAVWALAIAAGGRYAPRLRLTPIHLAIAAVVAVACLSLVVNARALNHALELELGVKKLTLLVSYLSLFVVVASVVRRSEVAAFLKYTLALAVVCALGMIWEYRFKYNIFYAWSDQLLPGIFEVGSAESEAVDDMGRRIVRGPAQIPLEAVAMMAMALPVALVGLIRSSRAGPRLLYALATALLLAATVSTYRKSAFVAPISVVLTLAYFRRRELIRLAPLGLVILVLMHVLSPGAFGSIVSQLSSDRLNAPTVSDRTADYDAVRPDVWAHLMFGRGYGSYEHTSYRLLDQEFLRQLIEVGVVGVAAYLLMIGSVVAVARRPIRLRRPADAPVALVAAAGAVAFAVISLLFDVMSFPHAPYIFLSMAALLAAAMAPQPRNDGERSWSS